MCLFDGTSVILGVWAALGGFRTIQKGWGLSPKPFWMVLKLPGAAQTPKMTDAPSNKHDFSYTHPSYTHGGLLEKHKWFPDNV
jgi:hypothetical protein